MKTANVLPSPALSHADKAEMLLACIGMRSASAERALMELDGPAGRLLLRLLDSHGIAPYAYTHLRDAALLPRLPAGVSAAMAAAYERNAARNMVIFAELSRILDACQAAAVDVIPLKGAYLARAVYDDPACRVMGDIDIQIRLPDVERVAGLLRRAGYTSEWNGDADWFRQSCHLPAFHKPGSVPVEVHISLNSPRTPFRTDDSGVWQRARAEPGANPRCLALGVEDLILYLCIHLHRARLRVGLRHLLDIHRVVLVRGGEIDADALSHRARAWNMERTLWAVLGLADDLLGLPMPGGPLRPPPPFAMNPHVLRGARARMFREATPYSATDLLCRALGLVAAPFDRTRPRVSRESTEEPVENRAGPAETGIRKFRRACQRGVSAVASCSSVLRSSPGSQWRTIVEAYREQQFARWMGWM